MTEPEVLLYLPRRDRRNGHHGRKHWRIIAAHRLPVVNHRDYHEAVPAPLTQREAVKCAASLNRLHGLSPATSESEH